MSSEMNWYELRDKLVAELKEEGPCEIPIGAFVASDLRETQWLDHIEVVYQTKRYRVVSAELRHGGRRVPRDEAIQRRLAILDSIAGDPEENSGAGLPE